jgi:inorganic pyrophosphatase
MRTAAASRIATIAPVAARGLEQAIIDTPRGSRQKYKFDAASGLFKPSRILPEGLHFPCDFGFIPGTVGEDGDALDVALLSEGPSVVGCLMTVRLLGVIRAKQIHGRKTIRNDRFLAVPVTPVNKPAERDLRDIAHAKLDALERFFIVYNQIQGRTFRPMGRTGGKAAATLLRDGIRRCQAPPGRSK